jgi:hypothetical protein
MDSHLVSVGTVSLRIQTPERIRPESAAATRAAEAVAKALNHRFFQATIEGQLPGYVVRAKVKSVRAGSVITELALHAHVLFESVKTVDGLIGASAMTVALGRFAKDYPEIRKGVLMIVKDFKQVAVRSIGLIKRVYPVAVQEEHVLNEEETSRELARVQAHEISVAVEAHRAAEIKAAEAEARRIARRSVHRGRQTQWRNTISSIGLCDWARCIRRDLVRFHRCL